MEVLDSEETLERARQRSHDGPVILYKHSSTCGVSLFARREVRTLQSAAGVPVFQLVVQRSRAISNQIAERFGIRHESPQVVVLHRDRPIFTASHGRIRASTMQTAIEEALNGSHSPDPSTDTT